MFKKSALYFLLFVASPICYGQKSVGITLYQNTDIYSVRRSHYFEPAGKSSHWVKNFNRLSLAVRFTGTKTSHELEVLIPEFSKTFNSIQFPHPYDIPTHSPYKVFYTTYSARYEINRRISGDARKLSFLVGGGVNPYFIDIDYDPLNPSWYGIMHKQIGLAVNFIPRVKWQLSRRFILDLNVPLDIYDFRMERRKVQNPNIPIRHQHKDTFGHFFFEKNYTIRLGLTYIVRDTSTGD